MALYRMIFGLCIFSQRPTRICFKSLYLALEEHSHHVKCLILRRVKHTFALLALYKWDPIPT